jgi:hypothetical protein
MRMAWKHAEFTFNPGRNNFLDLLAEEQVFRSDDL